METESERGTPELPVFSVEALQWYCLQATAVAALGLGICDFIPKTEEDLRCAIKRTAPDVLALLDSWNAAYAEYCNSMRSSTPDQWDRRRDAEDARAKLVRRLKTSN